MIDLAGSVLKNSCMSINQEYFHQILRMMIGTILAPILVNVYAAKLEKKDFGNVKNLIAAL